MIHFLTLAVVGGKWSASCPGHFTTSGEEPPIPLYKWLGRPQNQFYLLKLRSCLAVSICRLVFNSINSVLAKSKQLLITVVLITPSISAPNSKQWLFSFVLNITHSSSRSFTGFLASGNPSGLSKKEFR